jgi:hypothetical protein
LEWYHYALIAACSWWVLRKFRHKTRESKSRMALSFVTPFLSRHGIPPDTIVFSSYSDDALCKDQGSIVLVGYGLRHAEDHVGFVIEVAPSGRIVDSAFIQPGPASHHRSASLEARQRGQTLLEALVARDKHLMTEQHDADERWRFHKQVTLSKLKNILSDYDEGSMTRQEFLDDVMKHCSIDVADVAAGYDDGELTYDEFVSAAASKIESRRKYPPSPIRST